MHPDSRPPRRSIRLPGCDYRLGGEYFVTLCTWHRALLLDKPRVRSIISRVWHGLPARFPGHVELDACAIMPNHIHGILVLVSPEAVALQGREGGASSASTGGGTGVAIVISSMTRRLEGLNGAPYFPRSAPSHVNVSG